MSTVAMMVAMVVKVLLLFVEVIATDLTAAAAYIRVCSFVMFISEKENIMRLSAQWAHFSKGWGVKFCQ